MRSNGFRSIGAALVSVLALVPYVTASIQVDVDDESE